MRAVRFGVALLFVFVVHLVAMRFLPSAARSIDLFLIVIAVNAIDGSLVAAMFGGLAAGLAADGLSGALYGLHGFAGTATGFLIALVARQLVLQQLGRTRRRRVQAGLRVRGEVRREPNRDADAQIGQEQVLLERVGRAVVPPVDRELLTLERLQIAAARVVEIEDQTDVRTALRRVRPETPTDGLAVAFLRRARLQRLPGVVNESSLTQVSE